MTRMIIAAVGATVFAVALEAGAQTCRVTSPLFCDNFDAYPDNAAFYNVWIEQPGCGGVRASNTLDTPAGCWDGSGGKWVKVYEQNINDSVPWRHFVTIFDYVHDLTPEILAFPTNSVGQIPSVNGAGLIDLPLLTDNTVPPGYVNSLDRTLRPEALKGRFQMQWPGQGGYANGLWYFELSMDDDHAPYNWEWVYCDGALASGGKGYSQPRLIRTGDNQVHKAFAIGVVATYDANPCDLDSGWKASQDRVVVYDGRAWKELRAGYADLPFTSPANLADPMWKDGCNLVDFAIGAEYIEVRLRNVGSETLAGQGSIPNGYWVARIPRLVGGVGYVGPFNKISIGSDAGMDVTVPTCENFGETDIPVMQCNGGSRNRQSCVIDDDCPAATAAACPRIEGSNDFWVDNVELYDGVFAGPAAACCQPDRSCSLLDQPNCEAAGGVYHDGVLSCTPNPCCPSPWADFDADTDVDMDDFAALQRCLTIDGGVATASAACLCFDRDGVNGVDVTNDVEKFVQCAAGANVAVVSCPP